MPPKTSEEDSAETAKASPAPSAAAAPATLRNRHATAAAELGSPSCTTPNPPAGPAAVAENTKPASKSPSLVSVSFIQCLLVTVVAISSVVVLFLGVQIAALDGMDLSRTATRLKNAGRGEVPFPIWLGNLVVHSLTASRVEAEGVDDGRGAGGGTGRKPTGPPPPLRPLPPTPAQRREQPGTGGDASTGASADAPAALRCYTLEAYSETFLRRPRNGKADHVFSCGTRVSDLRSTTEAAVLAACDSHTVYPESAAGERPRSDFPTLRVVLTPSEEALHRSIQPVNTVTQRVPLAHFNDDYCDCMDGTDELLTNACSMSGPLFPLAGSRWKPYLVSHQAIQLYDTPDALQLADAEARGAAVLSRKRGDVSDRLYVSQGPVLPFVCMCGTVRQLLAPSLVGDGVVDCCNGDDEAVMQGSPFVAPPQISNDPPPVQAAHERAMAAVHAAMQRDWQQRQKEVVALLAHSTVSYSDNLFPYHTSARALLVDKGYYTLFPADVVQRERRAAATMLHDLYARGHITQRRRVQNGWERLGQGLMENRTRLQMEVANITHELEALERFVHERMSETRATHPLEAGIPMELLQRHDQLAHAHQSMQMELQHFAITSLHHAYGDHYEYYPLVRKALAMAQNKVTDANTPSDLYSGIAQERARRVVTPSRLEQRAVEAQQRGQPLPPLHIDNISASHVGIEVMRHTMAAHKFDASEAPLVAQRLGLVPPDSAAPFNPRVFDAITDPFLRAPVLPLGSWQPYQAERDGRSLQLADPAGDLHLARRACVSPASPLFRGGGRLQTPTRHPEAPRTVSFGEEGGEEKTLKEKLKAAAESKQATGKKVEIPYHFHTPSVFVVDKYVGTVRCDPDPLPPSAVSRYSADDDGPARETDAQNRRQRANVVQMYVAVLCDTKDRLLYWGRNGKCTQEVIVGSPSACTAWALKAARDAVKELTPQNATAGTPSK